MTTVSRGKVFDLDRLISPCCGAPVVVEGNKITKYFACSECHAPIDPIGECG